MNSAKMIAKTDLRARHCVVFDDDQEQRGQAAADAVVEHPLPVSVQSCAHGGSVRNAHSA